MFITIGVAAHAVGGADPCAPVPAADTILHGTVAGGYFGYSLANAGDLDGDGDEELLVGALDGAGHAYVFSGGPGGLVDAPSLDVVGTEPDGWFGYVVRPGGDVDGDGFPDVVVGSRYGTEVRILRGSPTGPDGTSYVLAGVVGFGAILTPVGDRDQDGFDDLMVGIVGADSYAGDMTLYRGSGLGPDPDLVFGSPYEHRDSLALAGDPDGDGRPEMVVSGCCDLDSMYVYPGDGGPPVFIDAPPVYGGLFAAEALSPGDVTGDGVDDLLVSAMDGPWTGGLALYPGSAAALFSPNPTIFPGPQLPALTEWGLGLADLDDLDGDGDQDIAVAATFDGPGHEGSVGLYGLTAALSAPTHTWVGGSPECWLGHDLAAGDFDGDGRRDLAIAAIGADTFGPETGSVYVIYASTLFPTAPGDTGHTGAVGDTGTTPSGDTASPSTATGTIAETPPARGPAEKEGCGCRHGAPGSGLGLLALLGIARRTQATRATKPASATWCSSSRIRAAQVAGSPESTIAPA